MPVIEMPILIWSCGDTISPRFDEERGLCKISISTINGRANAPEVW